jgi:hypothetical protein
MVGLVTNCRACGGRLSVTMADLGMQPPSNAFLATLADAKDEKRYPLRAKVCERCKLVQVDYDVAPEELFGNYHYFSSFSDEWLAHARRYCEMARRRFALDSSSLVVELASNDGYLLKNFVDMGIPVLGIDPSDTVAGAARGNRRADPGRIFRRGVCAGAQAPGPMRRSDHRQQCAGARAAAQ